MSFLSLACQIDTKNHKSIILLEKKVTGSGSRAATKSVFNFSYFPLEAAFLTVRGTWEINMSSHAHWSQTVTVRHHRRQALSLKRHRIAW